ncbi:MAG: hypothetical protein M0R33_14030 [Methylomonas sp.]|jgi:hypothetical protein|uniref:hypothetical protein n=1 Tax=Methylomonas sp. TaxID=418 RepID=UPI0025E36245|nr:hypothetical protein [Methylomonas sp.]MCK9607555.1 hypothetical protein [Methylomonas sp.]
MAAVKIKQKKVHLAESNDEQKLAGMFDKVLNSEIGDVKVSYPRYLRLCELIARISKVISLFSQSNIFANFASARKDLLKFLDNISEFQSTHLFFRAAEQPITDIAAATQFTLTPEETKIFTRIYPEIREKGVVRMLIITCDRIVAYKTYLSNPESLNGIFLENMSERGFHPFAFCEFNIRDAYLSGSEEEKKLILFTLHKLLMLTGILYGELSSPDICVDDLASTILECVEKLSKVPKLSRCRKAFQKILQGTDMLKQNFGEYYKDYIQTRTQSTIFESFISDVAKKNAEESDPELSMQFKRIVEYFRETAGAKVAENKSLKFLFDSVEDKFKVLDKQTTNTAQVKEVAKEARQMLAPSEGGKLEPELAAEDEHSRGDSAEHAEGATAMREQKIDDAKLDEMIQARIDELMKAMKPPTSGDAK